MTLRRTAVLAALVGITSSVVACSTPSEDSGGASVESGGKVESIAFDFPYTSLPVYSIVADFAKQRAEEKGVDLVLTSDDMNLSTQVSNLTSIQNQVDAVVSFPLETASIENIAKSYMDAGKPWVTYGGDMDNQDASLQFSFREAGAGLGGHAAAWANDTLGGKGTVLIITDKSVQLARERSEGLLEQFEKDAPGMEVIEQSADTPDEALSATNAVLAQHPDLSMVLAFNDDLSQAAYQALLSSGRAEDDPKTYVGGVNGTLFAFQKIKEGTFYRASAATSLKEIGYAIVDVPLAVAAGEGDASVNVPQVVIDKDSPELDAYLAEYN